MDEILKKLIRGSDKKRWLKRATEMIEANARYAAYLRSDRNEFSPITDSEDEQASIDHAGVVTLLASEMDDYYLAEFQRKFTGGGSSLIREIENDLLESDYSDHADCIADEAQMDVQDAADAKRKKASADNLLAVV